MTKNKGVIKLEDNEKKYKIDKITKPRRFVVAELFTPRKD